MTPGPQPPLGIVETELSDRVLEWEIDRPQRANALGHRQFEWLAARCRELCEHVVVFRSRGPTFCAGFDLDDLDRNARVPEASLIAAADALERARATFIAAIDGPVIGAGVEIVCACDLRLATHRASFAVPAARLGVVYHAQGVARFRRTFGASGTRRMLLLGSAITATEARAMGAVELAENGDLEPLVARTLEHLTAGSHLSLRAHRTLLRALEAGPPSIADLEHHEACRSAAFRGANERPQTENRTDAGVIDTDDAAD
jgi:enoyl-CoA hydratase/carnithine racemase